MKPYYQGYVDPFCAIYTIINAARWCLRKHHAFSHDEGVRFYNAMMKYVYDRDLFLQMLHEGIQSCDLMEEFVEKGAAYLKKNYGMKLIYERPFEKGRPKRIELIRTMKTHLKKPNSACIIRGYEKTVGDHWSVATKRRIGGQFKLFDSDFAQDMKFRKITLTPYADDGRSHLKPEGIFLITVEPI